jgi:hypothetical protein
MDRLDEFNAKLTGANDLRKGAIESTEVPRRKFA